MLPQLGTFGQNDVKLSNDMSRQPAAVNSKLNQINSMIGSRLGNLGSPGLAIQAGMFKAFGNNVLTQGASQLGGLFSDFLSKFSAKSKSENESFAREPDFDERRQPTGLAEIDRTILKEMLKSLLRIDKNIDELDGVGGGISAKKFNIHNKQDILSTKKDKLVGLSERQTAADLITRLETKIPSPARPAQPQHSALQERMHNISGNIESQAMQGVYSAFGYNTFTQTLNEGAGFIGDSLTNLVAGPKSKNNPTGDPHLERILNNPKTESGQTVRDSEPVVSEIKKSETILEKMLASLNSINVMFKKFFGDTDKISNQEEELEKGILPKPYKENGKYIFPPAALAPVLPVPPEAPPPGILDNILDVLTNKNPKAPVPPKVPGASVGIGGIFKNLATKALPLAIGAAPLAAMYGVTKWAENTEHDEERIESIKEASNPITDFFKGIGLDFGKKFENQQAKNREGLDTTEELEWNANNKKENAKALNNGISELEKSKLANQNQSANNNNTSINNTNINNQTILPSRNTTRNIDSTANRYFDNALR